jgi:hypothetical protein
MLDPAHLAAGSFVDGEGIELITPPTRLAVKVSLVIRGLNDLPMSAVFTIACENTSHLLCLLYWLIFPTLLKK